MPKKPGKRSSVGGRAKGPSPVEAIRHKDTRVNIPTQELRGFVEKRREALQESGPIDWAFAEAMAFASLVLEGTPVRLSGQDSGRGTFSQRHLAFYDSETGDRYIPLRHLAHGQASTAYSLSELSNTSKRACPCARCRSGI